MIVVLALIAVSVLHQCSISPVLRRRCFSIVKNHYSRFQGNISMDMINSNGRFAMWEDLVVVDFMQVTKQ